MRLPKWMRRRRRPPADDYEACQGADGLEAAVNWMRYVLARDLEGEPVGRCVIVAEVGHGHQARTLYTTHEVRATPVEVRGLLGEGLRALDEIGIRQRRQIDIEAFVNEATPQIVAAMSGLSKPSEEEVAEVLTGLFGEGAKT